MPDFEHSITLRATAEDVYDFVADVRNMPRYLPTTKHAESQGRDRVRVQGEVQPPGQEMHRYDADGYVRRLADRNRLEWGADEGHYSGWLEARDRGEAECEVKVHLSMREAPPGDRVQEGLVAALESIRRHMEGEGGKVEPSVTTDRGADRRMGDDARGG
jgi:uncharacterized membrane protein